MLLCYAYAINNPCSFVPAFNVSCFIRLARYQSTLKMGATANAILVIMTVSLVVLSSGVECCPPSEWAALMAFKAALKEPDTHLGLFHSWRGTNCCYHWYGISCDPIAHRVAEINFQGLNLNRHFLFKRGRPNLAGHISPAICNLTQLSTIIISDWKGISGEIPDCITSLPFLRIIDLGGNRISGKVPRDIGRLSQLSLLNLADNIISGRIPRTLVKLSNLMHLDLRNNAISGPIPWDFGRLSMLSRALLSGNKITGHIPWTISRIYRMADLDLSFNKISGRIPASLGRMRVLDSLNLRWNNISGTIPDTLLSSRITHLDLSRNALRGHIPNVFGEKTYFIVLDLSHNDLEGSVPKSITCAKYIGHLDISHNRLLPGRIPTPSPFF